ncbi:MAG: hypothetical protein IT204_25710 [Fimbriimonadaceae bacterium]|nr:hypothetical protein [Fimbriimonadaceae bacterium]
MSKLVKVSNGGGQPEVAVVFVHGLTGDAKATWQSGDGCWMNWLGEDFPFARIVSLDYDAAALHGLFAMWRWIRSRKWASSRTMNLATRAQEVSGVLGEELRTERALVWIAHSLGGLVAKSVLVQPAGPGADLRAVSRGIMFLGTPHLGARLAAWVGAPRWRWAVHELVGDLSYKATHLCVLSEAYVRQCPRTIATMSCLESHYEGFLVVPADSAKAGCGSIHQLEGSHHTISKPQDREALVYAYAQDQIKEALQPPYDLPPRASRFVNRQKERVVLTQLLKDHRYVEVVGPSGVGKTALVAEVLGAEVLAAAVPGAGQGSLSFAKAGYPGGVVTVDLRAFDGDAEHFYSSVANALGGWGYRGGMAAKDRAIHACDGLPAGQDGQRAAEPRRRLLVVLGGELATGLGNRLSLPEMKVALPLNARFLVLRDEECSSSGDGKLVLSILKKKAARKLAGKRLGAPVLETCGGLPFYLSMARRGLDSHSLRSPDAAAGASDGLLADRHLAQGVMHGASRMAWAPWPTAAFPEAATDTWELLGDLGLVCEVRDHPEHRMLTHPLVGELFRNTVAPTGTGTVQSLQSVIDRLYNEEYHRATSRKEQQRAEFLKWHREALRRREGLKPGGSPAQATSGADPLGAAAGVAPSTTSQASMRTGTYVLETLADLESVLSGALGFERKHHPVIAEAVQVARLARALTLKGLSAGESVSEWQAGAHGLVAALRVHASSGVLSPKLASQIRDLAERLLVLPDLPEDMRVRISSLLSG